MPRPITKLVTKTCPICGEQFEAYPSQDQKFCSPKCGYKSPIRTLGRRIPLVEKKCPQCGRVFQSERWRHQKFCSVKCGIKYHSGESREFDKILSPSHQIKFSFIKHAYKQVTINGHKMPLYRYVMEQHLGRKLRFTERVHHINGDKDNDDSSNLYLLSSESAHGQAHASLLKLLPRLIADRVVGFDKRKGAYYYKNGGGKNR